MRGVSSSCLQPRQALEGGWTTAREDVRGKRLGARTSPNVGLDIRLYRGLDRG